MGIGRVGHLESSSGNEVLEGGFALMGGFGRVNLGSLPGMWAEMYCEAEWSWQHMYSTYLEGLENVGTGHSVLRHPHWGVWN